MKRGAWQEAVAQWRERAAAVIAVVRRESGFKVKIFRNGQEVQRLETDDQKAAARKTHEEGMWMNPQCHH